MNLPGRRVETKTRCSSCFARSGAQREMRPTNTHQPSPQQRIDRRNEGGESRAGLGEPMEELNGSAFVDLELDAVSRRRRTLGQLLEESLPKREDRVRGSLQRRQTTKSPSCACPRPVKRPPSKARVRRRRRFQKTRFPLLSNCWRKLSL